MTLVKTLIAAGALALAGTSTANAQGATAASLGLTGGAATAAAVVGAVVVVGAVAAIADSDSAATTTTN